MTKSGRLAGRVAMITGAGSGIGKAAALKLAAEGAYIGVLSQDEEEVEQVCAEIIGRSSEHNAALPLIADISHESDVQNAYTALINTYGRLDVVFANAGINGVWAPLDDLTLEDWNRTLSVNLTGTFLTVKYALPHLRKQGGSVIVTSSVNGTRIFSNTGATAYSCTKAAQVAFTKMIALEVARDQIRVNVICPGAIETNIDKSTEQRNLEEVRIPVEFPEGAQPLTGGKPGRAEEVAELVLFLASDASSHISGTEIWIDGTESLLRG